MNDKGRLDQLDRDFFVAEDSSWITGQTISIDGGSALL